MSGSAPDVSAVTITPADAKELLDSKTWKYLDVRTAEEYRAGHVEASVNIPYFLRKDGAFQPNEGFLEAVAKTFPDKTEAIVVACQLGGRSAAAVAVMREQGYTNLRNMAGGFKAWSEANYPSV